MKKTFLALFLILGLLGGCASSQSQTAAINASPGSGANVFNPYMNDKLPNLRKSTAEGEKMLDELGARKQTIEGEAAHRQNWREEIYPVVFGERKAPGEILVLLNFSDPESENVWEQVVKASKALNPSQCKIAIFGNSKENYGTDLMGLAIWLAHARPGQAMPYLSYALKRWNEVKAGQKRTGNLKKFTNEYDATVTPQDFPIHYGYISTLKPPIPHNQELSVAKYCYNAGNVNMYQETQIAKYYGVGKLPAVIVNGKVLGKASADAILQALK